MDMPAVLNSWPESLQHLPGPLTGRPGASGERHDVRRHREMHQVQVHGSWRSPLSIASTRARTLVIDPRMKSRIECFVSPNARWRRSAPRTRSLENQKDFIVERRSGQVLPVITEDPPADADEWAKTHYSVTCRNADPARQAIARQAGRRRKQFLNGCRLCRRCRSPAPSARDSRRSARRIPG